MERKNPTISIVLPVYNVEDTITTCINSILHQTFSDWECIIVNDGSTDNSAAICKELIKHNDQFKYFDQKNAGLSAARNLAMRYASGEYVAFVDSDDWILPNYLERLHNLMMNMNADIVKCDYHRGQIDKSKNEIVIKEYTGRAFTEELLPDKIGSQLWQYLYKKELWDGIVSPIGRYAQDMMILHIVTDRAKRIITTNEKLYFYFSDRQNNTSNSATKGCKGSFDRAIAFMIRHNFAIQEKYNECKETTLKKSMDFFNYGVIARKKNDKKYDEDIIELKQFVRSTRAEWMTYNIRYKALGICLAYCLKMYIPVRKTIQKCFSR